MLLLLLKKKEVLTSKITCEYLIIITVVTLKCVILLDPLELKLFHGK